MNNIEYEIGKGMIQQERNLIQNQINFLNRKLELYKKILNDCENINIEKAKAFISWVEHSTYEYEEILKQL